MIKNHVNRIRLICFIFIHMLTLGTPCKTPNSYIFNQGQELKVNYEKLIYTCYIWSSLSHCLDCPRSDNTYPAGESAVGWSWRVNSPSLLKAAPAAVNISPTYKNTHSSIQRRDCHNLAQKKSGSGRALTGQLSYFLVPCSNLTFRPNN